MTTSCCARPCATSPTGEVAPVAGELDRTKAFPYEIVAKLGGAEPHGDPVPGGVRRRGRRHAGLRPGRRGARARRLVGRDHAVRPHVAGHAADLPVRHRGAEARVDAAAVRRRDPRRVRPDRGRGGLGRRQHEDARAAARRRVGHQRRQAVHHERRHRHLRARDDHGADRHGRPAQRSRTSSSPNGTPGYEQGSRTARWAGTRPTRAR